MKKFKEKFIVIVFILVLVSVFVVNLVIKDESISVSERRKLTQISEIKFEDALESNLSTKFEKYASDQFVGRDLFRKIKYLFSDNVYMQKDNEGVFVLDNAIYKMDYKLNEKNVKRSADKIKGICTEYLNNTNKIYFSIIPEKNYYLEDEHLKLDYSKLIELMKKELSDLEYIEISDKLNLDSYYRTDIHWKQEKIDDVVEKLINGMETEYVKNLYNQTRIGDLYGTYYSQTVEKVKPDDLIYLTDDTISNAKVFNYETSKISKVYDIEKYNKAVDKYDLFLSGATPLLKVTNDNADTDKELILFRDSFGSSITPLMVQYYKTITLVDLRYISSKILKQYIDFDNKDVLFLFSSTVLNSNAFK